MWGCPDNRCEHCWHRVGVGLLHRQGGEEVLQSNSNRFGVGVEHAGFSNDL